MLVCVFLQLLIVCSVLWMLKWNVLKSFYRTLILFSFMHLLSSGTMDLLSTVAFQPFHQFPHSSHTSCLYQIVVDLHWKPRLLALNKHFWAVKISVTSHQVPVLSTKNINLRPLWVRTVASSTDNTHKRQMKKIVIRKIFTLITHTSLKKSLLYFTGFRLLKAFLYSQARLTKVF